MRLKTFILSIVLFISIPALASDPPSVPIDVANSLANSLVTSTYRNRVAKIIQDLVIRNKIPLMEGHYENAIYETFIHGMEISTIKIAIQDSYKGTFDYIQSQNVQTIQDPQIKARIEQTARLSIETENVTKLLFEVAKKAIELQLKKQQAVRQAVAKQVIQQQVAQQMAIAQQKYMMEQVIRQRYEAAMKNAMQQMYQRAIENQMKQQAYQQQYQQQQQQEQQRLNGNPLLDRSRYQY